MSTRPALSGPLHSVPVDDIDKIKRELSTARHRIDDLELELQKQKNEAKRALQAISGLRDILKPQFQYFRAIFGEIESVELPSEQPPTPQAQGASVATGGPDRFDAIKRQLGGKQSEIIQAIQTFGPSTRTQLRASAGGSMSTIDTAIYSLRDKGVIVRNGDAWSLKGL